MSRRPYDDGERDMMHVIGVHLRALRQAKGWSVRAAAKRAGINRVTLTAIETGRVFPGWSIAFRLASVYGATLASVATVVDEHFGFAPDEAAA